MQNQQNSLRQQTELRQQMTENRLHVKFVSTITFIATVLVILLFVFQLFFLSWLHIPFTLSLGLALVVPSLLFVALAGLIAYIRSTTRTLFSIAPPQNANRKQA
jgi:glucan phosphoethanolaminetransferase (alkaline phosphatase superfamily)